MCLACGKELFCFFGSTSCCLFSHYLVFLLKQFCQGRKQQADTEKLLLSPVIRLRASFPFVPTPSPSLSSRHHPRPAKYYYNYTLYCFYLFFRHPQLFSALSSFTCLSSSVYGCPSRHKYSEPNKLKVGNSLTILVSKQQNLVIATYICTYI